MGDSRVLNLTRGFRLKKKQAYQAIELCSMVWVEEGITVRDLAPAEAIRARNLQARSRREVVISENQFHPNACPLEHSEPFGNSWVDRRGRCADTVKSDFCGICGITCTTVYDHCHKTEIFRGWLCGRCNSMLGFALDSPETLRKAAIYLENFIQKIDREINKHDGISLSGGKSE